MSTKEKKVRSTLLAAAVLVLPTTAFPSTYQETVIASCYEFPEVKESHIVDKQGDNCNSKSGGEDRYKYAYQYATHETVRTVYQDDEGKPTVEKYERVQLHSRDFRGEGVAYVKKLVDSFIGTNRSFVCKK